MKNIDVYVKPIKKILTISCFRGPKRPHSCAIGLRTVLSSAHQVTLQLAPQLKKLDLFFLRWIAYIVIALTRVPVLRVWHEAFPKMSLHLAPL